MDNQKVRLSALQFLAVFLVMFLCTVLFLSIGSLQGVVDAASKTYEEGFATLESSRAEAATKLGEAKEQLDAGEETLTAAEPQLAEAEGKLADAEKQLSEGRKTLDEAEPLLAEGRAKLQAAAKEIASGEAKLREAAGQLAAGEQELASGTATYNAGIAEYNSKYAEAQAGYAAAEAKLAAGEQQLAEGRQTLAAGQGVLATLDGVNSASQQLAGVQSNPKAMLTQAFSSVGRADAVAALDTDLFTGCATWDDYLARADVLIAMGAGASGGPLDQVRDGLVAQEMANQAAAISAMVDATLETEADDYLSKNPGYAPFGSRDGFKAYARPTVEAQVTAGFTPKVTDGVNEVLAGLGQGVKDGASGVYGQALQQGNAFKPQLEAMGPMLASLPEESRGPVQQVVSAVQQALNLPEGNLTEQKAKFENLTTVLNSPQTTQVLAAVKSTVNAQVEKGKADLAAGEQELAAGKQEYATTRASVDGQLAAAAAMLEEGRAKLADGAAKLAAGRQEYAAGQQTLAEGKQTYAEGQKEFAEKSAQYEEGLATWQAGTEEYEAGKAEYDSKKGEYEEGLATWEEGTATYNETKADVDQQLADGEAQITSAESMLSGLGVTFNKTQNADGTTSVTTSNSMSVWRIVILVVFVLLGILVSFLVVSSAIKKNGEGVGALKSQGASKSSIAMKFGGKLEIAAVIGAVLGVILAATAITSVIKGVAGDAVAGLSIPFPVAGAIICLAAAVVSALIGTMMASGKVDAA